MKRKNIIIFSLLLICVLSIFLLLSKKTLSPNTELKNLVLSSVEGTDTIDFTKLYDTNWDKMYVLPPYSNVDEVLDSYNISKNVNIKSNISTSDEINLIIFTKSNKIVSNFDLPRNLIFNNVDSVKEYSRNEANFKISDIK